MASSPEADAGPDPEDGAGRRAENVSRPKMTWVSDDTTR
jgi:hypothetical protein